MTRFGTASARSATAGRSSSARSAVAAEAVLSFAARDTLDGLDRVTRERVEQAIAAIEDDPSWGGAPARFLNPGTPANSGYIIDLSVQGWGIVYRVVDKGSAIEIPTIRRIFVG